MESLVRLRSHLSFLLEPDVLCLMIFALVLEGVQRVYGANQPAQHGSTYVPLAIAAAFAAMALRALIRRRRQGHAGATRDFYAALWLLLRSWGPLFGILYIYDNFHDMTALIRPEVVDGQLRRLDEALLGFEPSLSLQAITHPLLTEYMTVAYALFFFFPALILVTAYWRQELPVFREFSVAMSLAFYLGLLGYMLVPAVGPRYFMAHEFAVPLWGPYLTRAAASAWNSIEKVDRDCFPSLHTAISTISLIYLCRHWRGWRVPRVIFAALLVLIVSLWFSTLYLRYHYAVDVLAGWALALLCWWLAGRLMRLYAMIGSSPP